MAGIGSNYRKLLAASTVSNIGDGIGLLAYPWLASAVTRNPLLIAVVGVAQRLPWLVFTLPAGVVTDRRERRLLMISANTARAVLTLFVAVAVLGLGGDLPGPDELDAVVGTDWALYAALVAATLLLGVGEVFHDNAAQTFLPTIVDEEHLPRANGRLYAAETVANQFVGPPVGSLLLAVGFAVPFFLDAGTFAVAALLVTFIRPAARATAATPERRSFRADIREGIAWLWRHRFMRNLALTLGGMNFLSGISMAAFVLFAQEVLHADSTQYALLTVIGAVGAVVSGWFTSGVVERLGIGRTLRSSLVVFTTIPFLFALNSVWWVAGVLLAVEYSAAVMWNVVTVSLRQAIIPDRLLGRVNSVYRFFGWGAIPLGTLLGGVIVSVADGPVARTAALRAPLWVAGAGLALLVGLFALPRLTTAAVDADKEQARLEEAEPSSTDVAPSAIHSD